MTAELNVDTNMSAKPITNVSEMQGDTPQAPNDNAQELNANMPEQPIEGEAEFTEEEPFDDEDYEPDFIRAWLENPPLLPGEDRGEFEQIFESFELFHNGRPKTVLEYMMVKQATSITWEMMRFERMKIKIQVYHGRSAVEAIYRKTYETLATDGEPKEFKNSAKKWTQHYFTDPEYRKAYAAKLEAAGYGAGAVEVETFQRSLYSLSQIERLIANLEKRLFSILKRLDDIYAGRHPQMKVVTANLPLLPGQR